MNGSGRSSFKIEQGCTSHSEATQLSRGYPAAMAITGAHALLYTDKPEELRAVLRDAFGWDHVDAGGGWLIFKLPPAELGVHPAGSPRHELSFMCDDLQATMSELAAKGIIFQGEPVTARFGIAITMLLPGNVEVMLYQPSHPTAI